MGLMPNMDNPIQKRAGCEHNRTGLPLPAIFAYNATDPSIVLAQQVCHSAFHNIQPRCLGKQVLYGLTVQHTVRLRTWPLYGWPLGAIKQFEMNTGTVCRMTHKPIQCINFPHQMALAYAPNRRVAGHGTNRVSVMRQQERSGPTSGGCGGCLAPGVTTANHNHIVRPYHNHACTMPLFANTELPKNGIQQFLNPYMSC
jgi:hypothetical protein